MALKFTKIRVRKERNEITKVANLEKAKGISILQLGLAELLWFLSKESIHLKIKPVIICQET